MTDTAKFWNKIARKYEAGKIRQPEAYQNKLDFTQTFFTHESKVFAFACGTGTTALYHAPKVASILATDISSEMLAIAQRKQTEAGIDNVRFETWDVTSDPIMGTDFDMVMAHSILHLIEDIPAALRKSHDMLKPGGIFISSTVALGDWNPIFKVMLPLARLFGKAPKTVKFFKKEALYTAIKDAGFEIVDLPSGKDWGAANFIVAKKV